MAGRKKTRKQVSETKPKKTMDTDQFMAEGLEDESSDSSVEETSKDSDTEISKSSEKKTASKHKVSLEKLKQKDPEFYEYLQSEDKDLLNFDTSDDEEDEEDDADFHQAPDKLEVASDDSDMPDTDDDDDDDDEDTKVVKKKKKDTQTLVTTKLIKQWGKALRETSSMPALHTTILAFKAAVNQAGGKEISEPLRFKVEGSLIFNEIVSLCLSEILPALENILKLPKPKGDKKMPQPSSSKKWSKVRVDVKMYLLDVMELVTDLKEPAILNVLLKHVHQLVQYFACFPKLSKALMKKLITEWSTGEETSRVLAFLSINKLIRLMSDSMLEPCLKQMYMAYVKNCKFTTPSALPNINFMQRSLVEIFSINLLLAYQYGFIYIRQLAIHLRNSITVKKKETTQAVLNWQYVHSLCFWAKLLGTLHSSEVLQPLVYPLTQTIIGTAKLTPTARYFPLRFHCVRALNILSETTNTYIPVLPIILEVFDLTNFNKKHAGSNIKPFNFACILKLSKTQLMEKSFRDGVIDQTYELLLEQFHIHAHSIGFPELVLPAVLQMKQFIRNCKVANYTKQIKQIADKVEENSKVITQRRKTATLDISDSQAVDGWEVRSKQEGTPLGKYYTTWKKLRERELQSEIAGKERNSTDDIPVIERPKHLPKATAEDRKEFSELFDSDSDEALDDEERFMLKEDRPKKKQKVSNDDSEDDYSDLDSDEYDQLNKSASEDEDDEDDEKEENGSENEDNSDSDEEEGSDSEVEDAGDVVEDFEFSDED